MSIVSLLNVNVLNNPARFTDPYEFEITFECLEPLREDLEWKLVYVGSSTSSEHDQELDSLLVGPVPVGVNKFLFTADPPSPDLIPQSELVSVTVMLLSCSYRDKEFVQVGYYVNNEYDTEELRENPPTRVALDHVVRNILAEKPRVTRFNIPWDNEAVDEYPPEQPDADIDLEDDEDAYGNEEEDAQDELVDEEEADEVEVDGDDEDDEDEDDDEEEEDVETEQIEEPEEPEDPQEPEEGPEDNDDPRSSEPTESKQST